MASASSLREASILTFPACALHVSHAQHELNIPDQGFLFCLVLHSVVARGGNAWLATLELAKMVQGSSSGLQCNAMKALAGGSLGRNEAARHGTMASTPYPPLSERAK